jgi:hypothetical protein
MEPSDNHVLSSSAAKDIIDLAESSEGRAVYYWGFSVTVNTTIIIGLATLAAGNAVLLEQWVFQLLVTLTHAGAFLMSLIALLHEQQRRAALLKDAGRRCISGAWANDPDPVLAMLARLANESKQRRLGFLDQRSFTVSVHLIYWLIILWLIWFVPWTSSTAAH